MRLFYCPELRYYAAGLIYPNPDLENTIIAQPLSTPSKSKKGLTTNKVAT